MIYSNRDLCSIGLKLSVIRNNPFRFWDKMWVISRIFVEVRCQNWKLRLKKFLSAHTSALSCQLLWYTNKVTGDRKMHKVDSYLKKKVFVKSDQQQPQFKFDLHLSFSVPITNTPYLPPFQNNWILKILTPL